MFQDLRTTKTAMAGSTSNQQVDTNIMLLIAADLAKFFNSPKSLKELQDYCLDFYPSQQNNYIKTDKPFILFRDSEPLEYIYIFKNNGDHLIPQHWHYVGFGLSDINNYNELYQRSTPIREQYPSLLPLEPIFPILPDSTNKRLSGFGFELTFRLKCNSSDDWEQNKYPIWPCNIMQTLAKYVFQFKNVISESDNLVWQGPLAASNPSLSNNNNNNNSNESEIDYRDSIIEHLLITLDPQLRSFETSCGMVKFLQIVGVTQDELQAAREWNPKGILDMMKENSETGGEFLVTDMSRGANIFQLNPECRDRVNDGIRDMGSSMSIFSTKHKYSSRNASWYMGAEKESSSLSEQHNLQDLDDNDLEPDESDRFLRHEQDQENNYGIERGNLLSIHRMTQQHNQQATNDDDQPMRCSSRMSYESESALKIENAELAKTRIYDQIYLLLPLEAAKLLPTVALNERLAHKQAFTFKTSNGDLYTTLVPEGSRVENLVSPERPYVRKSAWLQIYISDELRTLMMDKLKKDFNRDVDEKSLKFPRNYSWPEHKLYITVVRDGKDILDTY